MRPSPPVLTTAALLALSAFCTTGALAQIRYPRERLGVRVGYVGTQRGLSKSYGGGSHTNIQFSERVYTPFYLQIRVGALNLGDLRRQQLAERFTNIAGVRSEMRVLFLSAGPQYTLLLGNRWTGYTSIEGGIYAVSLLFDSGIQAFDVSDTHFGGNVGIGAMWRVAGAWNLDLNTTVHYFRTASDRFTLFNWFSGGDDNPLLLQVSLGITLDLR